MSSEKRKITLETDDAEFERQVAYGATFDVINYKRLNFWTIFGTGFVILTILALIAISSYSLTTVQQRTSAQSEFYQVQELRQKDQAVLSTFGVVDLESGTYRAPIDDIISAMAEE